MGTVLDAHKQLVKALRIDPPAAGRGGMAGRYEIDIASAHVAGVLILVSGSGLDQGGRVALTPSMSMGWPM